MSLRDIRSQLLALVVAALCVSGVAFRGACGEAAQPKPAAPPAAETEISKKVQQLAADWQKPPSGEPTADAAKEIDKCIADFGSGDYKVRDAAYQSVLKHRAGALNRLRAATESKDLEVAERARQACADVDALVRSDLMEKAKALGEDGKKELARRINAAVKELTEISASKAEKDEEKQALKTRADALWASLPGLAVLQAASWGVAGGADPNQQRQKLFQNLRDKDVGKRTATVWLFCQAEAADPMYGNSINYISWVMNDGEESVKVAAVWCMGTAMKTGAENLRPNVRSYLDMFSGNAGADSEVGKAAAAVKALIQ